MGLNRKFWPGESISLRTFTPMVFLQDFLPILGVPRLKITNRSFWPACDQMVLLIGMWPKPEYGPFEVRPWAKFWPGETSDLYSNGPNKFPSQIFYSFWAPHSRNYESVFFDHHAIKWCFWPAYDQNQGAVLLTVVRLFPYLGTLINGATNGGLKPYQSALPSIHVWVIKEEFVILQCFEQKLFWIWIKFSTKNLVDAYLYFPVFPDALISQHLCWIWKKSVTMLTCVLIVRNCWFSCCFSGKIQEIQL